jgi:HSP20 family protein
MEIVMNIIRHQPQSPTTTHPTRAEWDPFRVVREMMRWDPFHELGPLFSHDRNQQGLVPDIDVKETADSYIFKADMPGVEEKDVETSLTGNRLTVSGTRHEEKREENDTYYACERSYGSFTRSITLPQDVSAAGARADLKDGVLTIIIPKKSEVQPKKIPVGRELEKKEAAKG